VDDNADIAICLLIHSWFTIYNRCKYSNKKRIIGSSWA